MPALCLVEDERNELLLSAASAWEIAIRHALGTLELPSPPEVYVSDRIDQRRDGASRLVPPCPQRRLAPRTPPRSLRPPTHQPGSAEQVPLLTADRAFEPLSGQVHWAV